MAQKKAYLQANARPVSAPSKSKDIETYLGSIVQDIEDAVDFFQSDYAEELADGLRYYDGEVDIDPIDGRSHAVSTQVRDAIRNLKPSILRVLCSDPKIVKYIPSSIQAAMTVEQQEAYIHQLFWSLNGYRFLYSMVDESLKMRMAPLKVYWVENLAPDFARISSLTADEVIALEEQEGVTILEVEEASPIGGVRFFDVDVIKERPEGQIALEVVPSNEFFISRNARSVQDARVHGHRRTVTVAEAIEMGIDYDKWFDLDDANTEEGDDEEITELRRGGKRTEKQSDRGDVLSHEFTLTEAYVRIDLEAEDLPQLYVVYFGGSNYVYLAHQREGESPFEVASHDPKAFAVYGENIADIVSEQQDVMTSLLRSILDNAHASNHPRMAANPSQVRFDDLMNHDIGHPIRMKPGAQIQVVEVPSTLQGSLPLLQWLESESQNKLGITKAAQGLDPDALQSTDKDAVKNTIMLAQGQVELMVRNFVETGLIPVFRKMLKLSIQHLPRQQIIAIRGTVIPVDQMYFDPNMYARPMVGLGARDSNMRSQGLQVTLQTQLNLYNTLGMDNPFVNATNIYNTLEDMTEQFGLTNVSRYYNLVTPEVEAAFAKKRAEQAAQAEAAKRGKDPADILLQTEQIKAGTEKLKLMAKAREKAQDNQLKAIELNAKDDLERDKMAQQRVIDIATLFANTSMKADENQIKKEQAAARPQLGAPSGSGAAESPPKGESPPSRSAPPDGGGGRKPPQKKLKAGKPDEETNAGPAAPSSDGGGEPPTSQ